VPLAYGLLAAVLTVIAMLPSLRPAGRSLTVLPRVGAGSALAATEKRVDPGFRLVFARRCSVRRSALP
jgi:type IV secretory pathway TrbD component